MSSSRWTRTTGQNQLKPKCLNNFVFGITGFCEQLYLVRLNLCVLTQSLYFVFEMYSIPVLIFNPKEAVELDGVLVKM